MKQLQGQRFHTGKYNIDYLNISACLLLIVYNGIDLYIKDLPILSYLLYFVPYLVYPIIQYFIRPKSVTAVLYLIVGLLTLALDSDIMGMSGLLYIFFSYNEIKNNRYAIIIFILSFIAVSLRFYMIDANGSESIVSIILLIFLSLTFYFKIIRDNTNITKLKEEEKAILKLYSNGYSYELIVTTLQLNITPITVQRKIKSVREKSGCKNNVQFGKWLYKNA